VIGKVKYFSLLLSFFSTLAIAQDVSLNVVTDRTQIPEDESVSLKFIVTVSGNQAAVDQPVYSAPDFELVNTFNSTQMQSVYENGNFSIKSIREITHILRPKKSGKLKISNIKVSVNNKNLKQKDITVEVVPSGSATPPPQGYGGSVGLRGGGKKVPSSPFFVRAELNKSDVYKGEQLIVSYYLYKRARVFNVAARKFPDLKGFFKEEMPVANVRQEHVVLDGVPYQKKILARYAIYPLKSGKLKIDSMEIQANYYPKNQVRNNNRNFDPFEKFFNQLRPRSADKKSAPIFVNVKSLPLKNKPDSFSGAVGEFNVISAIDRYKVRANEPVTLKVKIEGRGNVASIAEPNANWPNAIELFESKGRTKTGQAGVSQKLFEFLLIPREPGRHQIPELEFVVFDPIKEKYILHRTKSVDLNVLAPKPGTSLVRTQKRNNLEGKNKLTSPNMSENDIRYLLPLEQQEDQSFSGHEWWKWIYWTFLIASGFFVLLVLYDLIRLFLLKLNKQKSFKKESIIQQWKVLHQKAKQVSNKGSWKEVTQTYESIGEGLFDALDAKYKIGARALSRSDLERILIQEKGLEDSVWQRLEKVLEYSEMIQFAQSGDDHTESRARSDLSRWIKEGERLAGQITT